MAEVTWSSEHQPRAVGHRREHRVRHLLRPREREGDLGHHHARAGSAGHRLERVGAGVVGVVGGDQLVAGLQDERAEHGVHPDGGVVDEGEVVGVDVEERPEPAARLVEQRLDGPDEEVDRIPLHPGPELGLQREHLAGAGAERAVVEEGDLRGRASSVRRAATGEGASPAASRRRLEPEVEREVRLFEPQAPVERRRFLPTAVGPHVELLAARGPGELRGGAGQGPAHAVTSRGAIGHQRGQLRRGRPGVEPRMDGDRGEARNPVAGELGDERMGAAPAEVIQLRAERVLVGGIAELLEQLGQRGDVVRPRGPDLDLEVRHGGAARYQTSRCARPGVPDRNRTVLLPDRPADQKGQFPGAGASIRRIGPWGTSCTATVFATASVWLRIRCTWPPPGSTKV